MDVEALTDEEWQEFFGEPAEPRPKRGVPRWAKVVAALAIGGMIAGAAPQVITLIDRIGDLTDREEIEQRADAYVARSEYGWLVTSVAVVAIGEPTIGGSVSRVPADGVIRIDHRSWDPEDLDETVAHEIGHLLDFAIWPDGVGDLRGGLESEVWAECSAVSAGERRLDREGIAERYRCTPSEFDVYEARMAAVAEICRPWGEPECRETP